MGDEANVYIHDGQTPGVYLYAHWTGTELPETVRVALERGVNRWTDTPYLARIIFSEMIRDAVLSEAGYGISAVIREGADRVVDVNIGRQMVTLICRDIGGDARSFHDYVKAERSWPQG